MFRSKWKKLGIITGLSLTLAAAGCGGENTETTSSSANGGEGENTSSIGEQVDYTITGIEPGAGISVATEEALQAYDSLSGWEQETSSTAAMLTQLDEAVSNEEPIIVAGWNPHHMFAQHDLKYLDDPQGIYGEAEYIATIAREGLQEEMPEAYTVLERVYWDIEEVEAGMLEAQETENDFATIAQQWVDQNPDRVEQWTEGVDSVDGTEIELVTTSYDSAHFVTNITGIALEQLGYNVTITQVDPAILFQAIATGDADASLAAWLPLTHGAFFEEHADNIDEIGANSEGAKIGLAVPTYMDIDSIEDLEPNE